MARNPFDDTPVGSQRKNPFDDDSEQATVEESIGRIEHSARTVRRLKQRLGAEGLTISATRELIDEVSAALDAAARTLRELAQRNSG